MATLLACGGTACGGGAAKAGSCLVTTSDGNLLSIGGTAGGNGTPQRGVHRYKTADNRWDNLGSNPFSNFVHRGCGTVTNSATGKGRYLYDIPREFRSSSKKLVELLELLSS